MAKNKGALIKFSGKLGDEVHINSGPYASHVRKAPKGGKRKTGKEVKERYMRTSFMNRIASDLNNIIGAYSDHFKTSDFYHRVQSRLRKEMPSGNRFLELYKLRGIEMHPDYPFNRLGQCKATVRKVKNKTVVSLSVQSHPKGYKLQANCYYYEALLLTWSKNNEKAAHELQMTEWMNLNDEKKEFEFGFAQPTGAMHWLLCLRQRLGINEETLGVFRSEGMQVYDVGTFDRREADLLKQKLAAEEEQQHPEKINAIKQVKKVVRVKALPRSSQ